MNTALSKKALYRSWSKMTLGDTQICLKHLNTKTPFPSRKPHNPAGCVNPNVQSPKVYSTPPPLPLLLQWRTSFTSPIGFSFRLTGQLQFLINLMACSLIIKMLYGWAKISIKQLRHQPCARTVLISTQNHIRYLVDRYACLNSRQQKEPLAKTDVLTMTLLKPWGFRDVRPWRLVRLSNFVQPFPSHLPVDMASRTKTHYVYRLLVNVNENSSHRLNPDFTVTGREVHDKPWTVIPIQSVAWSFFVLFLLLPVWHVTIQHGLRNYEWHFVSSVRRRPVRI